MLTIELPTEIESALYVEAERLGKTAEVLATDILRERLAVSAKSPPNLGNDRETEVVEGKSLADYLKGYVGGVNSSRNGPKNDRQSDETAAEKPETAETERTAADFFAGYFGNVDSSKETGKKTYSSVDTGKKFTEIVVKKHRRDRL